MECCCDCQIFVSDSGFDFMDGAMQMDVEGENIT